MSRSNHAGLCKTFQSFHSFLTSNQLWFHVLFMQIIIKIHHFHRDSLQLFFFLSPHSSLRAISSFREFTTKKLVALSRSNEFNLSVIYMVIYVYLHVQNGRDVRVWILRFLVFRQISNWSMFTNVIGYNLVDIKGTLLSAI